MTQFSDNNNGELIKYCGYPDYVDLHMQHVFRFLSKNVAKKDRLSAAII